MKAAPLPRSIIDAHKSAVRSPDNAQMMYSDGRGNTYWYQGYTTRANADELNNYYSGLLGVKGFSQVSYGSDKKDKSKFDASWTTADGRYTVRVYNAPGTSSSGYILYLQDTGASISDSSLPSSKNK
jgi:hypothetical protein